MSGELAKGRCTVTKEKGFMGKDNMKEQGYYESDGKYYETEKEPTDTITREETDKKCVDCGGTMDFDPATGKMVCPYCGRQEEIQIENKKFVAEELDFNRVSDANNCDWGTKTKKVVCKFCGAQTVYSAEEIANVCPYCGSNQVMEEKAENIMAPGGVVPFRINSQDASVRFKKWIGRKFFCPKLAKESARPKAFQGLYVPYWTFDADTGSRYSGQYGKHHTVKRNGKMVTETRWYSTSGYYQQSFDDMLVCGASSQNQQLLAKMEPYDTQQVVEYKPEYMAGFVAESYTVKVKDAWETAKDKMEPIIRRGIARKIEHEHGAQDSRVSHVSTSYANVTYKYLLLPVWISSFQYNDKVYYFAINGQTGRVAGKTPLSPVKIALTAVAIVIVILILSWLYGGY